jgi:hypothetical protein
MTIETMSRDELIEAIVDFQIHTFISGQSQSELRHILLYGHGYKTYTLHDDNNWTTEQLREYAKDLGVLDEGFKRRNVAGHIVEPPNRDEWVNWGRK